MALGGCRTEFCSPCGFECLPGGVLPVNPSTLRVWKQLQKFDPSGYPSGGVRDPSGLACRAVNDVAQVTSRWHQPNAPTQISQKCDGIFPALNNLPCRTSTCNDP